MTVTALVVIGYLVGSIPTGLLVGRIRRGIDVREYGSGKTGFTNTLRSVGLGAAIVVVAGDIAKGALPVLLGRLWLDDPLAGSLGAAAAVLGHTWPVFAGFRGGRGVATAFGAFLAVSPLAALVVLLSGIAVLAATRVVSLMSMLGTAAGLVVLLLLALTDRVDLAYLWFGAVAAVLVEWNHRGNARRLAAGTEPRIGRGGERRTPAA